MASIDPAALDKAQRYRLFIGTIVPRPIAWVSTVDDQGRRNLAPFSFFNGVSATPPVLSISIGYRSQPKDTLVNLRSMGEAVVHMVDHEQLANCHQSGGEYAVGIDEATELGLEWCASEAVAAPRLAAASVAFECRLLQEVPVGEPATSLCLLSVERVHVRDDWLQADGIIPDPNKVRAVARLGSAPTLMIRAGISSSRELRSSPNIKNVRAAHNTYH